MAGLEHLKSLSIQGQERLTDDDTDQLLKFTELEELDVSGCSGLSDAAIRKLAALKKLRGLKAGGTTMHGTGFDSWADHPLVSLSLEYHKGLNAEGLRAIAAMPGLRQMWLFAETSLSPLAQMPSLTELHLRGQPTDDDFHAVGKLSLLEVLTARDASAVTDAGVLKLGNCHKLFVLKLRNATQLSDDCAKLAQSVPALRELRLSSSGLTNEGLAAFARCKRLRSLDVSWSANVGRGEMKFLAGCENLIELNLQYCTALDDAGLKSLGALDQLRTLRIGGGSYTHEGMRALKVLKNLERLDFGDFDPRSADTPKDLDVVTEIRKALPRTAIPYW